MLFSRFPVFTDHDLLAAWHSDASYFDAIPSRWESDGRYRLLIRTPVYLNLKYFQIDLLTADVFGPEIKR